MVYKVTLAQPLSTTTINSKKKYEKLHKKLTMTNFSAEWVFLHVYILKASF